MIRAAGNVPSPTCRTDDVSVNPSAPTALRPEDVLPLVRAGTADRFSSMRLRFEMPVSGPLSVPVTREGAIELFFPRNSTLAMDLELAPGPTGARLNELRLDFTSGERGRDVQVRNFSALVSRFKGLARFVSGATRTSLRQITVDGKGQVTLNGSHTPPSLLPFPPSVELSTLSAAIPPIPVDVESLMQARGTPGWIATPELDPRRLLAALNGRKGNFAFSLSGTSGDTQFQLAHFGVHARHVPIEGTANGSFAFTDAGLEGEVIGELTLGALAGANAAIRAVVAEDHVKVGGTAALRGRGINFAAESRPPERGELQVSVRSEPVASAFDQVLQQLGGDSVKLTSKWWVKPLLAIAERIGSQRAKEPPEGTISGDGDTEFELRSTPNHKLSGAVRFHGDGTVQAATGSGPLAPKLNSAVSVAGTVALDGEPGEFHAADVEVRSSGTLRLAGGQLAVTTDSRLDLTHEQVKVRRAKIELG
ncbi:MAG: hypothetical protein AAFU77_17385 [Myxococcota bacterium]